MATPHFAPSPYKEPAKADLRGGATIQDIVAKYNLNLRTAERYAKEVKDENSGKKPPPNSPGGKTQTQGGKLSTITGPNPAAVVFSLGNVSVLLDPKDLYEAFLLYEDLIAKIGAEQSFSSVLKDGVALLWEVLAKNPQQEVTVVQTENNYEQTEVTNEYSGGDGKAEVGAEQRGDEANR